MFSSKCLVSKKGPLGAIWVAAYFFKKLKKSQIFETNISSSVDDILQDQLEILAYRVLAYLLLGVVRIYSKKVDYLFDDCQEVLIKIKEFVVREKSRAEKEALRASCFSITRPVSFDLDAFDLEVLEDTSRDNVVPLEEITLKDVAWKNTGIRHYSLGRLAALDDKFLTDYAPTEDLPCHLMDFETEAGTSHCVWNLEASMEKCRCDESFNEEVIHLETVCMVEEEPSETVKVSEKIDRGQAEVPDMTVLEKHMDQEASREKCNDRVFSEEGKNHHSDAEEDPLVSLRPLTEDHVDREEMKGPDISQSVNEMHQAMGEDQVNILEALAEVPDVVDSESHMETEASREKCNDRFFSEEGLNHHSEAEEECLSPVKLFGEDQGNSEVMKGLDLQQPENEVEQFMEEDHVSILVESVMKGLGLLQPENEVQEVMEEDHVSILEESVEVPDIAGSENHIGTDASREKYNGKVSQEEYLNTLAEVEKKFPGLIEPSREEQTNTENVKGSDLVLSQNEVQQVLEEDFNLEVSIEKLRPDGFSNMVPEKSFPLGDNIQTGAEQVNLRATMTSEDGKSPLSAKDHPLSVTLDTTPQTKSRNASGAATPRFTPIRTPATKERARFSRKRKCFCDEMIVFPNNIMRQWIKDASDLVSKRGKGGRIAQAASKTPWIFNLPQSFSEASVPCTSELKSLYCGKRLRVLESVKIMKPLENTDVTKPPPPVGQSFVQAEIAPEAVEIKDPPDNLNLSERPLFDISSDQAGIAPQTPVRHSPPPLAGAEQTEIAPQTPVLLSKSVRPFESPENRKCDDLDDLGPMNVDPREGIESLSLIAEYRKCDDLGDLGPSNVDPSESTESLSLIGSVEKEPSLSNDEDLDLNLDIHSNEDDKPGQGDGWSMRTRMVTKYLQKRFLSQRERGEEEKVKLSQLLEGRTKKASARLFYEVLVLNTKGLVNVRQDTAFGDILVMKARQWDRTYRTGGEYNCQTNEDLFANCKR